jgi:hypothetical protein
MWRQQAVQKAGKFVPDFSAYNLEDSISLLKTSCAYSSALLVC